MIKTTFEFTPSPDGLLVEKLPREEWGHAHYAIRWILHHNGQTRQMPEIHVPLDAREFTIPAPQGSAVEFLFAYVNEEGRVSQAHQQSFRVNPKLTPATPGVPTMKSVAVGLAVTEPADEVSKGTGCGNGCGCQTADSHPRGEEQPLKIFSVQVSRHKLIKEGATGIITHTKGNQVAAIFHKEDSPGPEGNHHWLCGHDEPTDSPVDYYATVADDCQNQITIEDFCRRFPDHTFQLNGAN